MTYEPSPLSSVTPAQFGLLTMLLVLLMPDLAYAQNAGTVGEIMGNVVSGTSNLPPFITAFCYIIGTYLAVSGIFKTVDHVREPDKVHLIEPLRIFIIGGTFFAVPTIMSAVAALIGPSGGGAANTGGLSGGGAGLDGAMMKMVSDILSPGVRLVSVFCYISGVVITVFALSRLLKSTQEGPKGPTGFGTWSMFIIAGLLFSNGALMHAFQGTLGMEGATYNILSNNVGMDGDAFGRAQNAANAAIGFLIFIGWISFARGIFILKDVADGSQQASFMAGLTHLVGGALAVNFGPLARAVENTLGVSL